MSKSSFLFLFCLCFSLVTYGQIIDFPDPAFKQALIIDNGLDLNGDGELEVLEAESTSSLYIEGMEIMDVSGIEFFKNVTSMTCKFISATNIDLTGMSSLTDLIIEDVSAALDLSGLTSLNSVFLMYYGGEMNFSGLSNLSSLSIYFTGIDDLDLVELQSLEYLFCLGNNNLNNVNVAGISSLETLSITASDLLTSLDLSGLTSLTELDCSNNISLASLNLQDLSSLSYFDCINNANLQSLDISGLISLGQLNCSNCNLLNELDISNSPNLSILNTLNTSIEFLNFSNGTELSFAEIDISNLKFVCLDDENEKDWFLNSYPQTTAKLHSECNYSYGGAYYPLTGQINFDLMGDCNNITAISFANEISFEVSKDGTEIGTATVPIRNDSFIVYLPSGDIGLIPIIDNILFSVDPASYQITLPTLADTIHQDFCVLPGMSEAVDIVVNLIPLDVPRAGFEVRYKIVFSNLGNTPSSGEVYMNYHDPLVQFSSATLAVEDDGARVSHNYVDLQPFERREMIITMKLNSPMDTPPLNGGEYIGTALAVVPNEDEHNLNDNYASIREEVLNSLDPNDKQCLQGTYVSEEIAGKEVNYLIRFENIGNGKAINITVTDTLNQAIFDPSTVRVVDASHSVYMQQRGNLVEFIFENINLPFDDDNNDGYVAFSVKAEDGLVVGDSLLNNADIFFDFNWPIRTNTARSVLVTDVDMDGYHNLEDCDDNNADINPVAIDIPGNGIDEDCNGSDALSSTSELANIGLELYPNPAANTLNAKHDFTGSVCFRSLDGRVVHKSFMGNRKMDISALPSGFYILECQDEYNNKIYVERIVIE